MSKPPVFKVRIYSDHAIVNSEVLISPLKNLGARLLEMAGEAVPEPVKKVRRAKKAASAPKKRRGRKAKTAVPDQVNADAASGIETT